MAVIECPKCKRKTLRVIDNHPESKGYGYCDHCQKWVKP